MVGLGDHDGMAHQPNNSMKPPRLAVISLAFIIVMFAIVWGAVTVAVQYGSENCPNQVGGTGATGCR